MNRALEGLKVLDLSMHLPGPYLTWLMAGLGAQVVKLENPRGGDYARTIGGEGGAGPGFFASVNTGKKSLALDLKHPAGRELCLGLLETHDVLVEGFRPGVMERLGLDYATTSAILPRLIHVSITGYGQEGGHRLRAGHDVNYLALAGVLGITGGRGGELAVPGVQIADLAGGSWPALAGLLAAVIQRERTGRGQFVDVAMFDGTLSLAAWVHGALSAGLEGEGPANMTLNGRYPCYGVYAARDGGHMSLGALEPKFWLNFCRAVGRPDLEPQQFGGREAVAEVAAIFAGRDRDEWSRSLEGADCCCEPVLGLMEAVASPLARERGLVRRDAQGRTAILPPWKLSDSPPAPLGPPPGLGQHTAEVLAGLGLDGTELDRLRGLGVIA